MEIEINNKIIKTPIFLPDATKAVVKGLTTDDVVKTGIKGLMVNSFHVGVNPGIETVATAGGLNSFMKFPEFVATDSGGWQIFSLIQNSEFPGILTDEGVQFSLNGTNYELLTPEQIIINQYKLKPDLMVCLDAFTAPNANKKEAEKSVKLTLEWAQRSNNQLNKLITTNPLYQPILCAPVQGGFDLNARKKCAKGLVDLGFKAFGLGGYIVENGQVNYQLSGDIVSLLPQESIKFALGFGTPWDISTMADQGWQIFDCTLPTRDARHHRLYTFSKEPENINDLKSIGGYQYLYINRGKYADDQTSVDQTCTCELCTNYNRAYLNQLFKVKDPSAMRLATIHNLTFYQRVIDYFSRFKVALR